MLSARRLVVALAAAIIVAFAVGPLAAQDTHPSGVRSVDGNPVPDTAPRVGVVGGNSASSASATPEPTTMLLMGAGLAGLYSVRRRR